jgi:hypothetical protein
MMHAGYICDRFGADRGDAQHEMSCLLFVGLQAAVIMSDACKEGQQVLSVNSLSIFIH